MWNCYKLLKCSILKWKRVYLKHIYMLLPRKESSEVATFLYMSFAKNLALSNSPKISLHLRLIFTWKDLQKHPNLIIRPLGLFILSLHDIFMQTDLLEIQYCKLLLKRKKNLRIKWFFFLQKNEYKPLSSHKAYATTALSYRVR